MSPRRSDANACTSFPRSRVISTNYNEGSNEAHKSPRCTQPVREERRSCPSIRRLQMERHQMKENMEQLLNMQTRFVKDLEDVLNQHDVAERRKRELLHKHWTERLWLPLQKRLIQRVASCGAAEIKRRQGLYSHYLQHCNSKLAEIEDRPKQAWNSICLHTESKNDSRQFEKLPPHLQSSLVSGSSVRSWTRHGTPSSSSASSSTKTLTEQSGDDKMDLPSILPLQ
uniref:Uncharacterized protein n=1 Tax=Knipowitschia caucasica TaxID=637954 RepID=A0AAV2K9D4_KNICA